MKTEFYIIPVMALLMSATFFMIYQNPNDTPKTTSFEKHSDELVQLNELSKKYHLAEDTQRFENSKRLMQEKVKEISLDHMGLKIVHVELLEGYYPFQNSTYWAEQFDLEPSSVCDFERVIPLHMQKLSQTENFERFTKKYGSYDLELSIQDERSQQSNIHYGLFATNNKNQSASTYFHLSSCTNEITDKAPLFLHCFDSGADYRFATHNYDDIVSSYSNGEFCKIILDPWRQSVFDYSQVLYEKQKLLHEESMKKMVDQESQMKLILEMNKQGDLRTIVGTILYDKFDEQGTHDMIKDYEKQYGSLPNELLEIIEKRK